MNGQDTERWETAQDLIPSGVNTLSKHPSRFVNGIYPKFVKSAKDCFIESLNGTVYTDFIASLGAIILGYSNPFVDRAVKEQIGKGVLYPLSSTHEADLAGTLRNRIPCAEMSKFFKTGSEATSAAVKVARAYTGREKILTCGYHGWHDWCQALRDQDLGIPKCLKSLVGRFDYNSIESFQKEFTNDTIAGVIMEPARYEEPKEGFLEQIKEICFQHGTVLIFDEILSGFRLHPGGAQSLFKVIPDVATFSKAMANGYAISTVCGKKEVMSVFASDRFFCSGTFNGDLVGIAAARATLDQLYENNYSINKRIWKLGEDLKTGFNSISLNYGLDGVKCVGYPVFTQFKFPTLEHKAVFNQQMCLLGVLLGPNNFIYGSHSPVVIQAVLNTIDRVLWEMKSNWDNIKTMLKGELPFEVVLR